MNTVKKFDTVVGSDLATGERYALLMKQRFVWVPEANAWFYWNGTRWQPDTQRLHFQAIKEVIDDIWNDIALYHAKLREIETKLGIIEQLSHREAEQLAENNSEYQNVLALLEQRQKWIAKLSNTKGIDAGLKCAMSEACMVESYETFDSKGKFIGVQNGVVNIETGEFIENNPSFMITKQCGASYDPSATCHEWLNFLTRIFENDEGKIDFIQRLMGQALLGKPGKDKLAICCGTGANGKSTLFDTMEAIIGDYAKVTSAKTLTDKAGNKEYYVADLKGVRLALINETQKGAFLDEETVKSLVDSGRVSARYPFGRPFNFQPMATPVLITNYEPRITADYAINRRLAFIRFDYTIPATERDPKFRDNVLAKEYSGILNWMLEGYQKYRVHGLTLPESIQKDTDEFIQQNDRTSQFIAECCSRIDGREKIQDFKDRFSEWGTERGYKELGLDRISQDLKSRGFEVKKANGGYFYVIGLRLKSKAEISDDFVKSNKAANDSPQPVSEIKSISISDLRKKREID